jgi:hypothetical protein
VIPVGARTATLIEHAISPTAVAELRARLTDYRRYALVDRGSYDVIATIDDPVIRAAVAPLVALAARATERALALHELRAIRLHAGDYLLAHHDRIHEGYPIELVLDLSPAPSAAEVHFRRRGQVMFRMPSVPGSLAIVERGPTVTANHTYVSRRQPGVEIVRLVALATDLG